MEFQQNISLKSFNTFNIECRAANFVELHSLQDIKSVIDEGRLNNQAVLVLGGGSNLLFTKDFDGLVLHPCFKGIEVLEEDEKNAKVRVAAGEVWEDFVAHTVEKGWMGIENLALIPGLMGAAPMQNIGAYGVELKDVFDHLRAVDLHTGNLVKFSKEECEFGYRTSIFKTSHRGQFLIYDVCLNLKKNAEINVSYRALRDYFGQNKIVEINQRAVFDAVVAIRDSKLPKPEELGSAGSFFKNPVVDQSKFENLKKEYPDIVGYPQENGEIKLAAGWLIDQAGLKGYRIGNVGVHEKQALVLVNYGGATGKEVFDLSVFVQEKVNEKFSVWLEPEVNMV